jgi:hypothetical protein
MELLASRGVMSEKKFVALLNQRRVDLCNSVLRTQLSTIVAFFRHLEDFHHSLYKRLVKTLNNDAYRDRWADLLFGDKLGQLHCLLWNLEKPRRQSLCTFLVNIMADDAYRDRWADLAFGDEFSVLQHFLHYIQHHHKPLYAALRNKLTGDGYQDRFATLLFNKKCNLSSLHGFIKKVRKHQPSLLLNLSHTLIADDHQHDFANLLCSPNLSVFHGFVRTVDTHFPSLSPALDNALVRYQQDFIDMAFRGPLLKLLHWLGYAEIHHPPLYFIHVNALASDTYQNLFCSLVLRGDAYVFASLIDYVYNAQLNHLTDNFTQAFSQPDHAQALGNWLARQSLHGLNTVFQKTPLLLALDSHILESALRATLTFCWEDRLHLRQKPTFSCLFPVT